MTRNTHEVHDGRATGRGGDSEIHRGRGRLAARVRAVCLLLCVALALQPSLLVPGHAASRARFADRSQSSLVAFTARSLLAVAASIASVLTAPRPTRGVGAPAPRVSTSEPEPAAVVVFLSAPAGLSVNSTADSTVQLSWQTVSGAVGYKVERSPDLLTSYLPVGDTTTNSFQDVGLTRGSTYLYRVRAVDASGALSPPSAAAMATAITFLDPELIGANDNLGRAATVVKADHVNDLRTAVAGVRRAAALPAPVWAEAVSSGVPIRASHVNELRQKLDEALAALGLSHPPYTDPTLQTGPNGTRIKKAHFDELRSYSTRGAGVIGSGLSSYDFASARLDPSNRTGGGGGVDLISRNFNWSIPLVSLPGRAGLDLGLSLSYNSLVWTKSGGYVLFDGDGGWPAPGFRLGFPVVQGKFYDAQAQKYAYMLVTPSGARVSLRQTATAGVYEAGDSSYLQLTEETNNGLTLRSTDGTRMSYRPLGGVYKCAEIKDRDGNFITVSYNSYENVDTVTDTLGRIVSFGYDVDGYLDEITQTWHRDVEGGSTPVTETHRWAKFYYDDKAVLTNFTGLTVFGPQSFRALTKVKLADDSSFTFNYTTWGQVNQVSGYAPDGSLLNYVTLDLPVNATQSQSDCPRPTERRDWAAYWNNDADGAGASSEEAVTSYGPYDFAGGVAKETAPGGTLHQETYETAGWKKGITTRADEFSADDLVHPKKWTTLTWTQDDEALGYEQNPRVKETNVYDSDGNRRRTEVTFTSFGLPLDVKEYDADATTVVRRTHTVYVPESINTGQAYAARRIIGLSQERDVYGLDGGQEKLFSKATFEYDLANVGSTHYLEDAGAVAQHDGSYGASFATRGNLCRTRRWDVGYPDDQSKSAASEAGYDTLGSALFNSDALGHKTSVSYADSDAGARLAYPTKVTDPDGFYSKVEYNYDAGVVTRTVDPKGAAVKTYYDAVGRVLKSVSEVNGAYTGFEYGASGLYAKTLTKVDDDKPETFAMSVTDGAGRVRGILRETPGEAGGYAAQRFDYDVLGRQTGGSNPVRASVNANDKSDIASWQPAGEDTTANGGTGWVYTTQTYDWKGRPRVTTNTDGTTREAAYGGCGCAGGEVVTTKGELVPIPGTTSTGSRTQKVYHDALGRPWKTEALNWDGSVYTTKTVKYNALDQVVRERQYAGAAPSPEPDAEGDGYQTTTLTYDGHGRPLSRHLPRYDAGKSDTYLYNPDDTVQSFTDPRGVKSNYSYNGRRLPTGVTYDQASGISHTPDISFSYDEAGNRASMSDGTGSVAYHYDALSRLDRETRTILDPSNAAINGHSFPIVYEYNWAGELKGVTDPFGAQVSYAYDQAGKVTDVTGQNFAGAQSYATGITYRAWGALKGVAYGDAHSLSLTYDSRLRVKRYDIPGLMTKEYNYNGDGLVRYTQDLTTTNSKFDRAYVYDHLGRVTQALTGQEARGGAPTTDRPYNFGYAYDAWGNMTDRPNSLLWSNAVFNGEFPQHYKNDRNDYWWYDAAGNVVNDFVSYTYDAAGRLIRVTADDEDRAMSYDGDGRRVKSVETLTRYDNYGNPTTTTATSYELRSAALGGQVLVKLDGQGQRQRGYVYLGGSVLAWQEQSGGTQSVVWEHRDASGSSLRVTGQGGAVVSTESAETDPSGMDAGLAAPPQLTHQQHKREDTTYPSFGDAVGSGGTECRVDGVVSPCSMAMQLVNSGAADVDPRGTDTYALNVSGSAFVPDYTDASHDHYDPAHVNQDGTLGAVIGVTTGQFVSAGDTQQTTSVTPQNPAVRRLTDAELAAVRKELKKMLASDKCREFIDKLVSFNTGESFSSKDKLLDWLDRTAKAPEGGIYFAPGDGGMGRNKFGDYARIEIGPAPFPPDMLPSALQAHYRSSATTLLHELIHSLTHGSDDRLSANIQRLGIVPIGLDGKPMDYPTQGSNIYAYSAYWGTALKNACYPGL